MKWHGEVSNRNDPDKRYRIKATIPDYLQNEFGGASETSWALPAHCGVEYVPPVGAGVWVEWAARNAAPHEFIWSGEYASVPDGVSEVVNVGQEPLRGDTPYGRGFREVTLEDMSTVGGSSDKSFTEPESFQATTYPDNKVIASPDRNVVMELDDSDGGRFHVTTGEYYHEATSDGAVAQRCSVRFDFVLGNESRLVEGDRTEVVAGDEARQVEGDSAVNIFGHAALKAGSGKMSLAGVTVEASPSSNGLSVESASAITLMALQQIFLMGQEVVIAGAEKVDISSAGRVGMGVPTLGVQVVGPLAAGFSGVAALPGIYLGANAAGTIAAINSAVTALGAPGATNEWCVAVKALLAAIVVSLGLKVDVPLPAVAAATTALATAAGIEAAAPPLLNSLFTKVM